MIRNIKDIKETFPPKTGRRKSSFLQDPGFLEDVEDSCCIAASCRGVFVVYCERCQRWYKLQYTVYKVTVYIVCHVEGVEDSTDT